LGIRRGGSSAAPWDIEADSSRSAQRIRGGGFPEDAAPGNTEIVIAADEARHVVALLPEAIES
jgi:hypothetical protein